jgi:hypothetical protein
MPSGGGDSAPARVVWGARARGARVGGVRGRGTRALLGLALAALAALALGACGESHTRVTTGTYAGSSGKNAPYLNVGSLIYEVQLSRQLNPWNTEDASYLEGLPAAERELHAGEEWFGVFMQVYNNTNVAHPIATGPNITISDTQDNVYHPIIPPNPFGMRPVDVPAKNQVPADNTVAEDGPTQGAVLLYRIKVESLDNRPLTLHIVDPLDSSQTASAELDV